MLILNLKPIRLNKNLIQEPLKFEKELGLRFFKECILKFNQIEDLDKEIIFSFEELRQNFNLHNQEDFKEFMRFFHNEIDGRKNIFTTDKGDLIGGGVFSTMIYKDSRQIGAMINPYHKQFIYSKYDIENWHSVKGNPKKIEKLGIENKEKEKLMGLMTSFITDEIKGKYSQRLLDLLMQFKGSGLFIMEYQKFKEILEIPESYKSSDIDKQILNKSKKEFKKIGLIINDIEKIKKGRSIKTLKITFEFKETKKSPKKKEQKALFSTPKEEFSELDKAKNNLQALVMKNKDISMIERAKIGASLSEFNSIKEVDEFAKKLKKEGVIG